MDLFWPNALIPTTSRLGVDDFSASDVSAVTGSVQTSTLFGTRRLHMRLDFNSLQQRTGSLQIFRGLMGALQGRKNRIWLYDHTYLRRGSIASKELILNNQFSNGIANFLPITSTGSNPTLQVRDQVMRITRNSTSVANGINQGFSVPISTPSGFPYASRAHFLPGSDQSISYQALLINAGSTIVTTSVTSGLSVSSTSSASSATSSVDAITTNTGTIGNYFEVPWLSFAQSLNINGGSQTGAGLIVNGLPVSTNGLLLSGDQVQVGSSLCIVAAPLDSDSSGNGYLQLSEPIPFTPNNGDPVFVTQPCGRFMLNDATLGIEYSPGVFGASSLDFVAAQ